MPTEAPLTLTRLGDRPGARVAADVARVARWWFDEWAHESPGLTLDALCERIRGSLGAALPLRILAHAGDAVVGVAELKAHELRDRFPERSPWLGGVYVDPPARGRGVAALLVREIERQARLAGFRRLWLDTERLDGGLYARLGWQRHERIEVGGRSRRVMSRDLSAA